MAIPNHVNFLKAHKTMATLKPTLVKTKQTSYNVIYIIIFFKNNTAPILIYAKHIPVKL